MLQHDFAAVRTINYVTSRTPDFKVHFVALFPFIRTAHNLRRRIILLPSLTSRAANKREIMEDK